MQCTGQHLDNAVVVANSKMAASVIGSHARDGVLVTFQAHGLKTASQLINVITSPKQPSSPQQAIVLSCQAIVLSGHAIVLSDHAIVLSGQAIVLAPGLQSWHSK